MTSLQNSPNKMKYGEYLMRFNLSFGAQNMFLDNSPIKKVVI